MNFPPRCSPLLFAVLLAVASAGVAAEPAAPQFDIWEYTVEGNTVLSVEAIEKAVYPFLGEGKTLEDVERARTGLDKAYRDSGYPTVSVLIPEQSVASGVVRLEVVEGRVERLRITGARYHAQERIIEKVAAVDEGQVPYFPEVEKQMADVNLSSDQRVVPVLRPGHLPGTTEVELKVEDHLPLHAGIELSNRYAPSRAPNPSTLRTTASLRYDNLWQRDHSLSFSYQTAPEKAKSWLRPTPCPLAAATAWRFTASIRAATATCRPPWPTVASSVVPISSACAGVIRWTSCPA